jgi:hypothetical protein
MDRNASVKKLKGLDFKPVVILTNAQYNAGTAISSRCPVK